MNIEVLPRASVTTPASGFRNTFYDSDNGNVLTYKDSLGAFGLVSVDACPCDNDCACEISKELIEDFKCLAKDDTLTGAEYISLVQSLNIVVTSVWDSGTQTCTTTVTNTPAP